MIKYMIVSTGRYTYDHKALLDYDCIVNANYNFIDSSGNYIEDSSGYYIKGGNIEDTYEYLSDSKKLAYRIAVGKERNNLYKSLDYDTNYGYEFDNSGKSSANNFSISSNNRDNDEIYRIDVVIENVSTTTTNLYVDSFILTCGDYTYTYGGINTRSKTTTTITFEITDVLPNGSSIELKFGYADTQAELKSVKFYYK